MEEEKRKLFNIIDFLALVNFIEFLKDFDTKRDRPLFKVQCVLWIITGILYIARILLYLLARNNE